ncbi:MAG: hypothetical protein R3F19_31845 [Verrucomicrobiales bacterium]
MFGKRLPASLHPIRLFLLLGALLWFPWCSSAGAGDAPYPVAKGTDVVASWEPTQHLYVKGNVGVGNKQLQELEQWLDQFARNWTAVLVENADGETFTDAEGNRFTGMDAVDHALGKGLPNQTVFGQFVDDRTGQRNGAFFVLYLKERKFGYYGSDAFDKRGLGEDRWQGNLDAPAIAAMRSGGRIVDAVKDTITNIETRLTSAIKSERAARERAITEARLNKQRAQESIGEVGNEVVALEERIAEIRAALASSSGADGDLSRPDADHWRGELGIAANSLAAGNVQAARSRVDQVKAAIVEFHRKLDRYVDDGKALERYAGRLPTLTPHPESVDAPIEIEVAREALAKAGAAHSRMDSAYAGPLAEVEPAFEAFENANAMAAWKVKQREARQLRNQRLAGGSAAGGIVALLGVGAAGNRRRRKIKAEAERFCDVWETGLRAKTDALFALLDRTAVVVGSSADLESRGYAGETLRLSRQTIKDVDELFIMASCADGVLERAQKLTRPDGIAAKSVNLVAESRYSEALKLLREDAIQFKPADGLEHIMRSPRSDRESLLGDVKTYEPFAMSFDELIDAFNQRAERALTSLDTIENAWATIVSEMESVDALLYEAEAMEANVHAAATNDGWFELSPVFSKLLPSARQDYMVAVNLGGTDPVTALQQHGARSRRKAGEALALATMLVKFRSRHLDGIREGEKELAGKSYAVNWIGTLLGEFSEKADVIAVDAVAGPTTEEMEILKNELSDFAERVGNARKSALRLEVEGRNAISGTCDLIAEARKELTAALAVDPEALFCESDELNPVRFVERAKASHGAARAALDRGAVSAAEVSLDEVLALTADAREIVTATREAYATHSATLSEREQETMRLDGLVSSNREILERLDARYASSALRIAAADPAHENISDTIEQHIEQVMDMIKLCREWQALADANFRSGKILTAADVLSDIEDEQGDVVGKFAEIARQERELEEAEKENAASVTRHGQFAESLRPAMSDPKVSQATIDEFTDAEALAARARESVEAPHGVADPFAARLLLVELDTALDRVEDLIQSNRDAFAEAERSAASARRQLDQTLVLVRQADGDQIPDSPAINEARAATEQLVQDLQRVDAQLRDGHLDWLKVDAEADRIDAEGARRAAQLQAELERARLSVAAMQQAAEIVRGATGWAGSYGVRISGSPGYDSIERARQFLLLGDYLAAQQAAADARRTAEQALAAAQARVAQLRREEEERREAERRRRRAQQQAEEARRRRATSMSTGGGFGSRRSSGGGGFSSSSRSSGSRGSSFSSGSGVSRSGW